MNEHLIPEFAAIGPVLVSKQNESLSYLCVFCAPAAKNAFLRISASEMNKILKTTTSGVIAKIRYPLLVLHCHE
jgi:hypothetical protein